MRLDPSELDALADALAAHLVPRVIAQLREHLRPAPRDDGRLIALDDLTKEIALSAGTIRARVRDGSLPAIRIGRRVLFDLAAVRAALERGAP